MAIEVPAIESLIKFKILSEEYREILCSLADAKNDTRPPQIKKNRPLRALHLLIDTSSAKSFDKLYNELLGGQYMILEALLNSDYRDDIWIKQTLFDRGFDSFQEITRGREYDDKTISYKYEQVAALNRACPGQGDIVTVYDAFLYGITGLMPLIAQANTDKAVPLSAVIVLTNNPILQGGKTGQDQLKSLIKYMKDKRLVDRFILVGTGKHDYRKIAEAIGSRVVHPKDGQDAIYRALGLQRSTDKGSGWKYQRPDKDTIRIIAPPLDQHESRSEGHGPVMRTGQIDVKSQSGTTSRDARQRRDQFDQTPFVPGGKRFFPPDDKGQSGAQSGLGRLVGENPKQQSGIGTPPNMPLKGGPNQYNQGYPPDVGPATDPMELVCPVCGLVHGIKMTHCRHCGNVLAPGYKRCPKCGNNPPANLNVCPVCKTPLSTPIPPPPPPPPPPKWKPIVAVLAIILAIVAAVYFIVNVGPKPQPMINSFSASPTSVSAGGTSTLSWNVSNADSINIQPGIDSVAASGFRSVVPSSSTTYTISAVNSNGSANAATQIIVNKPPPIGPGPGSPRIDDVITSGAGKNLQIIVTGQGFGAAPVRMPFAGNTRYFCFFNATRKWSAGYNGGPDPATAVMLHYTIWTDNKVEIDGFAGEYGNNGWFNANGDSVGINFLNCQSGASTVGWPWVYDNNPANTPTPTPTPTIVPPIGPGPGSPRIDDVITSGAGKNLQIIVTGQGFGAAPVRMPFAGNTRYFCFFNATRKWSAGYNGGPDPATAVMLHYTIWTDNKVEIDGFAGEYGNNGWFNANGDSVGINFLNCQSGASTVGWPWVYR